MNNTEREALRRINEACSLIRSAYRLHPNSPADTIAAVRSAIAHGLEQLVDDLNEEAEKA